jgi:GT2 family glycosyltransferase
MSLQDITCILTFYKRPYAIHEQLHAIKNQSIPPKHIIIWINHTEDFSFPEDIRKEKNITIIDSSTNFGVWARFAVALLANTTYVCIFDDDTIPGKRWFENCLNTIHDVNGLLGTIGVVFKSDTDKYEVQYRKGWDGQNSNTERVDIVGHSWFFKRVWLQYLWQITPSYEDDFMFRAGEDIAFAYTLQKHGIHTYVPPHPPNDYDLYGSIPHSAWRYGTDEVAVSLLPNAYDRFTKCFQYFKKLGFKLLLDK